MQVHSDLQLLRTHALQFFFALSCTLHCPSVLAFSSEDKGSWRLAYRDLIAEAHFTLPKQGLIQLSTLVPLLTETCFCLRCSPSLCFLFCVVLKGKKKWDMEWAEEKGKMLFFLLPLLIACLIYLFNGADHVFHSVLRKDVPMHFSLYSRSLLFLARMFISQHVLF